MHFFLPTSCWHTSHISRKLMKQSQSRFHWQSNPKALIFQYFDVFSVWPSLIFPVQAKISTIQSKFPNYLSVSYHYREIKISLVIYLIYWLSWQQHKDDFYTINLVLIDLLTYWAIFKLWTLLVKKLNSCNLIISYQYYIFSTSLNHLLWVSFLRSRFLFLLVLQMRNKQ